MLRLARQRCPAILHFAPDLSPEMAQEYVPEDRIQPRPCIRPSIEPVEIPPGADTRLLHDVLRVRPAVSQPQRRLVEGVEIHQHGLVEFVGRTCLAAPANQRKPHSNIKTPGQRLLFRGRPAGNNRGSVRVL